MEKKQISQDIQNELDLKKRQINYRKKLLLTMLIMVFTTLYYAFVNDPSPIKS